MNFRAPYAIEVDADTMEKYLLDFFQRSQKSAYLSALSAVQEEVQRMKYKKMRKPKMGMEFEVKIPGGYRICSKEKAQSHNSALSSISEHIKELKKRL